MNGGAGYQGLWLLKDLLGWRDFSDLRESEVDPPPTWWLHQSLNVNTTFFTRKWGIFLSLSQSQTLHVFCKNPQMSVFLLSVNEGSVSDPPVQVSAAAVSVCTLRLVFGPSVEAINESCSSDFKESPQLQLRRLELNILNLAVSEVSTLKLMENDFISPPCKYLLSRLFGL